MMIRLEMNILSGGGGIANPPSGGGYDDTMGDPNYPFDYE